MSQLNGRFCRALTRRDAFRLAGACVLGAGLAAADPHAALAVPSASEETQRALEDAEARYEAALTELNAIGEELEALDLKRGETELQIDKLEERIERIEQQVIAQTRELEEAQEVLGKRMAAAYKAGGGGLLEVVVSSRSFEELASGVHYLDKVAESDREAIDDVRERRAALERRQGSLEEEHASLQELKQQLDEQTEEAETKQREAEELLAGLDAEVKDLMAQYQAEVEAAAEAERLEALAAASAGLGAGGEPFVSTGSLRTDVISAALDLLGVPYIYGGTYPTSGGTDCSGLVQWAFSRCGYSVPRTTYTQRAACQAAGHYFHDASLLQPGDLVFSNGGGHVAIYLGGGRCVHEPSPGGVCSVVPITRWSGRIVGYGFPLV